MNNNGIEDILIEGYKVNKTGKKKGFIILFLLLLIILIGLIVAYKYYSTQTISQKELFVKNISKTSINNLLQKNIYTNIFDKLQKEDSEIQSNINYSTTLENEQIEGVDFSKFILEVSNINNIQNSKSFSELKVNYSDNELFKANLLSTENEVALFSEEILDKYISVHYDKFKDIFGTPIDIEKIKQFIKSEKIDINEEQKNEYIKKYYNKVFENISEENFSSKENILINNGAESVDVTAYSLKLSQEELISVLKILLNELKNDNNLLEKLVSKQDETIIQDNALENQELEQSEENNQEQTEGTVVNNQEDMENQENTSEQTTEQITDQTTDEPQEQSTENTNNETQEVNTEVFEEQSIEIEQSNSIPIINITPVSSIQNHEEQGNNVPLENEKQTEIHVEAIESKKASSLNISENEINYDYILSILLGNKIDKTKNELKEELENLIKKLESFKGNGLTITIYASETKVENLNIELPNKNTIDLEFILDSELKNSTKITYLYKDNEEKSNGFSLELNTIKEDANTTINTIYNFIENEKINKKINLNVNIEGTINSKQLKNDIIITESTSEGERKYIIDNTIKFLSTPILEELTPENSLYLDMLSTEELNTTLEDIKNKMNTIFESKKQNLEFIDTNTSGSIVLDNVSTTITQEQAKEVLITKVSNMMQEAIDRNEEFTIQNLADLKIDGYKVSSNITEENAVIIVDIYTFNIDSNFTLTEVE